MSEHDDEPNRETSLDIGHQPGPGAEPAQESGPDAGAAPSAPAPRPRIGAQGRYEVGELLGRGGMAEVRKGTDTRLGRTVAIKRLRTDLAGDPTFQARFRREAQSAASLNHPSIVAVYDTGEEHTTDPTDGHAVAQPFIVMEYVAGRTLREILREGRKILPERALEITSGVLAALDYSHRSGIIHRDIKPGNVMLTPAGDVKVMDFGIARAMSDAQSTMTQTAAVVGTAQYLSPEQARGETVDSRSDVYSAGCLLFELLTGRPPFVGDSPVAVAYQHVREQPVPPSTYEDDLPPEVDAIVMKALAKKLTERYQSAAAMKADIDRYLGGLPVHAPAVVAAATGILPPATAAAEPVTSTAPVVAEDEPVKRSRTPLALLALLLAALVAAALIFGPKLFSNSSSPDQRTVPTVTGMPRAKAVAEIRREGLEVGNVTTKASQSVAKGSVISTDPPGGRSVDEGSAVDLVVSSGKPDVTIPSDIIGENKDVARQELQGLGLKVKSIGTESSDPENNVVNTSPVPGTAVAAGSTVTLTYSTGQPKVPGVVGMTQAQATKVLKKAGYNVQVGQDSESTEPSGTVTSQNPPAGQAAGEGSTVTILVSTYEPSPTATPTTPSPTATPTDEPTGTPSNPAEGD